MMYRVLAILNLFSLLQIDWYLHIWQNILAEYYPSNILSSLEHYSCSTNLKKISICGFQSTSSILVHYVSLYLCEKLSPFYSWGNSGPDHYRKLTETYSSILTFKIRDLEITEFYFFFSPLSKKASTDSYSMKINWSIPIHFTYSLSGVRIICILLTGSYYWKQNPLANGVLKNIWSYNIFHHSF